MATRFFQLIIPPWIATGKPDKRRFGEFNILLCGGTIWPPGTVNLNLVGLDLFTGKATVNVTVSNSSQGLYPLQVKHYGKELAVSTGLIGEYVVTNLEGKTLWNSRNISYLATSGETHVSPGSPVAVLSNGNWLLSLVSYPPHNSGLANQYLEEVYPSNGTLVWIHQFSFEESANSYQFMPPSTTAPPYVIVMPSQPPYIVYRWGSSLGCAALWTSPIGEFEAPALRAWLALMMIRGLQPYHMGIHEIQRMKGVSHLWTLSKNN